MHDCDTITPDFFERAPARYRATVVARVTPEQVFEAFEDAEAWPAWALPITRVEWTSPRPFGVGTTRTVSMVAGMVGEEEFVAWESPRRMSFRFTRSNIPEVRAFGEDYHVRALGDGRTEITWIMALEADGASRVLMPLTTPLMNAGLGFMLRRFGRYLETRYPRG
jgi:uncharacterized protein YndB with AHSA1/START domain